MAGDRYHITNQQDTYFITCTVIEWVDVFTRTIYKEIIVDAFKHCINQKGLVLNGWVIMTNHIHFIAHCKSPHNMSDFLRDFKKYTSKKLIIAIREFPESRRDWLLDKFYKMAKSTGRAKNFKVWTDDNHAINLHGIYAMDKLGYIHENPVKAGIVNQAEHYIYSSALNYKNGKGLIEIELL